jgi:hypothetical protein
MTIKPVNILGLKGKKGLSYFAYVLKNSGVSNHIAIAKAAYQTMLLLQSNGKAGVKAHPELLGLERRWYESLPDNPDYSVYGENIYLADTWCCWDFYARKYLDNIFDPSKVMPSGLLEMMGDGAIVDVGNGIGFASAALAQMFPKRKVIGTNIKGTSQWAVNEQMSKTYGYALMSNNEAIDSLAGESVALVFASEYFEHFHSPIDHLSELMPLSPTTWVVANAFGADSIGHFNEYKVNNQSVDKRQVGRLFGSAMRENGYKAAETTLWNRRPNIWSKMGTDKSVVSPIR